MPSRAIPGDHDHDGGLAQDLPLLISRRRALGVMATGMGAVVLGACGSDSDTGGSPAETAGGSGGTAIPEETPGPFPADGTNGPDVLAESGVVRANITTSFAGLKGTAEGVPTTVALRLLDVAGGGGPLAGAAVYIWHCTREAAYSLYEEPVLDQNFLRGVQVSDDDGTLEFRTIFPGCYAGRWPHAHFEVYESADAAAAGTGKLRTSQIAFPEEICEQVYGSAPGYEESVANLSQLSLESDIVFADGFASQLAEASGSVEDGIVLELNVGV
jgi:protocatechuate 3,4-dioxygenase beta subunit